METQRKTIGRWQRRIRRSDTWRWGFRTLIDISSEMFGFFIQDLFLYFVLHKVRFAWSFESNASDLVNLDLLLSKHFQSILLFFDEFLLQLLIRYSLLFSSFFKYLDLFFSLPSFLPHIISIVDFNTFLNEWQHCFFNKSQMIK